MNKISKLLLTLSLATIGAEAAIQNVHYKIKSGDSLYKIANKNNTTVHKLRKVNQLKKGEILKVGKVIKVPKVVPASKAKPVATTKYRIKKGDTLSSIARTHRTTISKIRKVNGLEKNAVLRIGNVLKVPETKKALRYTSKKKKLSNKKLASSLSNLETISLKKNQTTQKTKKFAFTDIFTSKSKKASDRCHRITSLAKTKLGKRYVWGATGKKNTFDCSGFTKYVYKKNGIDIPRTSIKQSKFGKYVKRNELQKGDLIFFDTSKRRKGYVNHVGIYLGDNKFIHASSAKKKVVITSLNKNFYSNRYKGARRPS